MIGCRQRGSLDNGVAMKFEQPIPEVARQVLARFGSKLEFTDREPDGVVDLSKSEIGNEDLEQLVFYPGFAALNLNDTVVSDAGMDSIAKMKSLENLQLLDSLISNDGVKKLATLPKLERLNIGCRPG